MNLTKYSSSVVLPVLIALSLTHLFNDLLQSVLVASYPIIKKDLSLSFSQIGIITLAYQLSASVFQPLVGIFFDRHPFSWSPMLATILTAIGLIIFSFASNIGMIIIAVILFGIGSSIVHPEASRITSLASKNKRGLGQSLFQVGGNLGGSIGPLLIAIIVAPYSRINILWFLLFSFMSAVAIVPIQRWFSAYLQELKTTHKTMKVTSNRPFSLPITIGCIFILLILIFSKYIYISSITSYYTFYLIEKFNISISASQLCLFVFLIATAIGTMIGGPMGDRFGRKYVIWFSILGAAPFTLLMPHVNLTTTIIMSFFIGLILSSAFPAILLYAQELLPYNLGLVSGLFFGTAFGFAGIAAAVIGNLADIYGIKTIYQITAYTPLFGLIAGLLPNLKKTNLS